MKQCYQQPHILITNKNGVGLYEAFYIDCKDKDVPQDNLVTHPYLLFLSVFEDQ